MSKINTSCEKCIFRKNNEHGVQNGCELNRLEKFIQNSEAIKTKDYYIIHRFCNTCRDRGYTKEEILKEVQVSCSVIVNGLNKDYWPILKSLSYQIVKPKKVFVIIDENFNRGKYNDFQTLYHDKNIQLTFKRYFDDKGFEEMVDDIVERCKTQFYIPIQDQLPENFIFNFNKLINEDLRKINAILTKNYYNSIVSCVLHKIAYGNNLKNINDKIKEYINKLPKNDPQRKTIIFK